MREATPYGEGPKCLIRDTDRTFGQHFARVAATSGIKVLRTPYRTRAGQMLSANAHLGKREARMPGSFPDLHEKQLSRLLKAYVLYFNQARPHQGIRQRLPAPPPHQPNQVISIRVLGGLHYTYPRAA